MCDIEAALSESLSLRASLQEAIQEERFVACCSLPAALVMTMKIIWNSDNYLERGHSWIRKQLSRYTDAAQLRDRLAPLQERIDAARRAEEDHREVLDRVRRFRLGQRVTHAVLGYRGAVCGWDPECAEGEEWQREAGVAGLRDGAAQPFYQVRGGSGVNLGHLAFEKVNDAPQVLPDLRDWASSGGPEPPITYVAQELLSAPQARSCPDTSCTNLALFLTDHKHTAAAAVMLAGGAGGGRAGASIQLCALPGPGRAGGLHPQPPAAREAATGAL